MLPVRPLKSPELIDTVVRAYDLTRNFDPIDLGGSSNLNLLLPERESEDMWLGSIEPG